VLRGLVTTIALIIALTLALPGGALAQEPTPGPTAGSSPILIDPLDPRAGDGASQVGAPLVALLVVVLAGLAAFVVTFAYVRLVRRS
jgi:hypothetical protein